MITPINQIAAAIEVAFYDILHESPYPPHVNRWMDKARTFLEPLHCVQTGDDFYGIDKATLVIEGFLIASDPWKGALATHLKRQLRNHLEPTNANHQS